jgi:hypothetical protein
MKTLVVSLVLFGTAAASAFWLTGDSRGFTLLVSAMLFLIYLLAPDDIFRSIISGGYKGRAVLAFALVFLIVANVRPLPLWDRVFVSTLAVLWGVLAPCIGFRVFRSYLPPER